MCWGRPCENQQLTRLNWLQHLKQWKISNQSSNHLTLDYFINLQIPSLQRPFYKPSYSLTSVFRNFLINIQFPHFRDHFVGIKQKMCLSRDHFVGIKQKMCLSRDHFVGIKQTNVSEQRPFCWYQAKKCVWTETILLASSKKMCLSRDHFVGIKQKMYLSRDHFVGIKQTMCLSRDYLNNNNNRLYL